MVGFVYIFSNPLYSRIKIGKSKRVPTEGRLSELSGGTETPEPFECEYYALVGDEDGLERAIHRLFDNKRPNKYREYFDLGVTEAINGIRSLADQYGGIKSEEIFHKDLQKVSYRNGGFYEGELREGRRNVYGTYSWSSGQKYIGDWKEDKEHGQGTLNYASGNQYIGDWENGMRHGQGTYSWSSGENYIGDWKDDKRHGQGTMNYASGHQYVGDWENDLQHGERTMTGPVKSENYISQIFIGKGTKWIGTWSKGKMHGQFKVVFPSGSKRTETYKNGKETTSIFKRMLR